jgi:hypothetical protein
MTPSKHAEIDAILRRSPWAPSTKRNTRPLSIAMIAALVVLVALAAHLTPG